MRKKTSIAAIALSVLMLLSAGMVYADVATQMDASGMEILTAVDSNGVTRQIGTRGVGFERIKALKGEGTITATSTTKPAYLRAVVTVQKLNKTTNVYYDYDSPFTLQANNASTMTEYPIINVGSSGTYRLKVVFSTKEGGEVIEYSPKYSEAVGL